MHRFSLYTIWNIAKGEYIKWITNPRIVSVGILVTFIHSFAIQPMLQQSEKYGKPLNVFEPFLAVCNSGMMMLFIPIVFILLMSDFPIMSGNTLFTVYRSGKYNWFLGQIMFVFMSIFSFLITILISCMIMSKGVFDNKWSESISLYDSFYPKEAGGFVSKLLPPNLYNQIPIMNALFNTTLLLIMCLFMYALILSLMKMLYLRTSGLFIVIAMCALGAVTCALQIKAQWFLPTSNTMIWLHYQELLREKSFPLIDSYLYFIIGNIVFIILNILVLRKLEFKNIEQEGD